MLCPQSRGRDVKGSIIPSSLSKVFTLFHRSQVLILFLSSGTNEAGPSLTEPKEVLYVS